MDDDQNQQTNRHPPGRGSQVSPTERLEIQRAFLTEPCATISGVAEQFGRTRETIAACLKGKDYLELKAQVQGEVVEEARAQLKRNALKAARHWTDDALEVAAKKGDHKPAKDLLTATGVIEPDEKGQQIVVQIGGFELQGGPTPDDGACGDAVLKALPHDERLDLAAEQLEALMRRVRQGTIDPIEAERLLDQIQELLPQRRCA